MALRNYGMLIGTITKTYPQRGGNPHMILMVAPRGDSGVGYRVAVNLQSSMREGDPQIQYQVIDVTNQGRPGLRSLAAQLVTLEATRSFLVAGQDSGAQTLDFVRGDLLDPTQFQDIPDDANPFHDAFTDALEQADRHGALVAVFGTGYSDSQHPDAALTGFDGIDNIHMNQGSRHVTGGDDHYRGNGPNQDGGLIFFLPGGARAFFVKFHTQSVNTDAVGDPTDSGAPRFDQVSAAARQAIRQARAPRQAMAPRAQAVADAPATAAFVFADPDPADASAAYVEDDDGGNFKAPYVVQFSRGDVRGPVPQTRGEGRLDLAAVVGANAPGYRNDGNGERIVFDMIGDSGAPKESKLPGELRVTELMVRNAEATPPAFLYHVGDVVYYYGEQRYFYSQFYEPFKDYDAPIFAIPGNHDAITYDPSMVSLDAFQQAFCSTEPAMWAGAGGIRRSTMIQPGVYFTLDAPLVSIIGLYSNCSESRGWLDGKQHDFLLAELTRLRAAREQDGRAVILAVHHCPRWFPGEQDDMSAQIDEACRQADFWPDSVVCGHAHLYQRIVRRDDAIGRDIPYLINGAGGYGLSALQALAKDYTPQLDASLTRKIVEEGYLRVTVDKPAGAARPATLRFEYFSTKATSNEPDDVCVIDLSTNRLA